MTAALNTGFPYESASRTTIGLASAVLGGPLCPSPEMTVTPTGGPATAVAVNVP
jgi:hypothetical protein